MTESLLKLWKTVSITGGQFPPSIGKLCCIVNTESGCLLFADTDMVLVKCIHHLISTQTRVLVESMGYAFNNEYASDAAKKQSLMSEVVLDPRSLKIDPYPLFYPIIMVEPEHRDELMTLTQEFIDKWYPNFTALVISLRETLPKTPYQAITNCENNVMLVNNILNHFITTATHWALR